MRHHFSGPAGPHPRRPRAAALEDSLSSRGPQARLARTAGAAALLAAALCFGMPGTATSVHAAANAEPPSGGGLTAVEGLKVGSHTLTARPTGCTVVLAGRDGAVGGVDAARAAHPARARRTCSIPINTVQRVNAIVLAGRQRLRPRRRDRRRCGGSRSTTSATDVGDRRSSRSCRRRSCSTSASGGSRRSGPTADCGYEAAAAGHQRAGARGQRRRGRRRDGRQARAARPRDEGRARHGRDHAAERPRRGGHRRGERRRRHRRSRDRPGRRRGADARTVWTSPTRGS